MKGRISIFEWDFLTCVTHKVRIPEASPWVSLGLALGGCEATEQRINGKRNLHYRYYSISHLELREGVMTLPSEDIIQVSDRRSALLWRQLNITRYVKQGMFYSSLNNVSQYLHIHYTYYWGITRLLTKASMQRFTQLGVFLTDSTLQNVQKNTGDNTYSIQDAGGLYHR